MALDALRQPLEEGRVEIMRGQRTLEFPANAILVAACNRCPCGRSAGPLPLRRRRARPLPAPAERAAARSLGPRLRGARRAAARAGGRRVRGPVERRRARAGGCARASASGGGCAGTGALCNGDMDGRLTRRRVPLDADGAAGLLARSRARRPERARTRPGAAGGADDRGPRRPRAGACRRDVEEALSYRLDGWERLAA